MANIQAYGSQTGVLEAYGDKIIGSGSPPSGTIEITENGSYDVTQYSVADVQVGSGLVDINPNQSTAFEFPIYKGHNAGSSQYIPVQGYKKLSLNAYSANEIRYRFVFLDDTEDASYTDVSAGWNQYVDIPNNAKLVHIYAPKGTSAYTTYWYSLLA